MPVIAAVAAAAFGVISAGAAVATAIGVSAFLGVGIGTWAAIGAVGMLVSGLALAASIPKPKVPESAGQQLNMKLTGADALPVAYGRTATGGTIYHRETFGRSNKTLAMLVALSVGGPIAGVSEVRANDYQLSLSGGFNGGKQTCVAAIGDENADSKMFKQNSLHFWHRLGATPETETPSQYTGLTIQAGAHSGIATAAIQADYDQKAFPQGLPRFQWVVSGQRVYDPRLDSTYPGGSGSHRIDQPDSWTFSENPHLCALNWTLGRFQNGKKVFGIGAPASEVDIQAFVAGANISDALGWKVGGVVTTTDDKFSVLGSILQAGGAVPVVRGAQISCVTNTVKTSVYAIGRDDVVGPVQVVNSTPLRERKNRIVPTYREESQFWNLVPGEAVTANTYVAEDNGEERSAEVTYPLVQQAAQAHQLAAYDLVNSREFLQVELTAKPRLLSVRVGDAITVNIPDAALTGQKFMVVSREFDPATFQVKLSLRSETDAKHAYALGQSQVAPPSPGLTAYDPSNPEAPGEDAWAIVGGGIQQGDLVTPAILVAGENDDPTTSSIIVEFRKVGETEWQMGREGPAASTQFAITEVISDVTYQVAVSYRTVIGIVSPRRELGSITTGQMVVGYWPGGPDTPNPPLIGIPPVLTDLLEGRIRADLVALSGQVTRTVEEALIEVEDTQVEAQTQLDGALEILYGAEEGDPDGLINRVVTLESSGPDGLLTQRVEGLEAKIDGDGTPENPGALARILELKQADIDLADDIATKADASVTSQLTTNLNGLTGTVTTLQQTVSNGLSGKVNLTDFTNLQGRVTTAEGSITGQNARLNTVEVDLAGKATATSVSTLASEITAARGGQADLSARFTQVGQTITDGLAGKAEASTVSQLQTTVGGFSSSIQTIQSTTANLQGAVDAKLGVILNANGYISGYQLTNNGTSSTFGVQADKFILSNGGTGIVPFAVIGSAVYAQNLTLQSASSGERTVTTNTGMKVYGSNGVLRVEIGILS